MPQLYSQDGGLQRVQAAVGADDLVKISFLAAVDAEHREPFGDGRIVGGDHATVASATEIFRGEKTETAGVAESAGEAAGVARTDGLRGVFDDDEIVRAGDSEDRVHVRGQSEEVDGHD